MILSDEFAGGAAGAKAAQELDAVPGVARDDAGDDERPVPRTQAKRRERDEDEVERERRGAEGERGRRENARRRDGGKEREPDDIADVTLVSNINHCGAFRDDKLHREANAQPPQNQKDTKRSMCRMGASF